MKSNLAEMKVQQMNGHGVVIESADRMIAPLVQILAAVGLSEEEFAAISASHYQLVRRSRRRRKLKVVVRDQRHGEILSRWATHPQYFRRGAPLVLNVSGKAPSFASLVREIDDSLAPSLILKDWCRSKMTRMVGKKRVELLVRYVPTRNGKELDLAFLAAMTRDFLHAHEYNILHGTRPGRGLFQRIAFSYDVHPRLAGRFNAFAREQATLLLEGIDDWLTRHQMSKGQRRRPVRLGLGIYIANDTVGRSRGGSGR